MNPVIPCREISSYLKSDNPWLIHVDAIDIDSNVIHGDYTAEEARVFIIAKPVPVEWTAGALEALNDIEFEFI